MTCCDAGSGPFGVGAIWGSPRALVAVLVAAFGPNGVCRVCHARRVTSEPLRQGDTSDTQRAVLDALRSLDGSLKSSVKLLSGLSDTEIGELGGLDR